MEDTKFSLFFFRGDELLAVRSVSRPADHFVERKLIATATYPLRVQTSDASSDLGTVLARGVLARPPSDGAARRRLRRAWRKGVHLESRWFRKSRVRGGGTRASAPSRTGSE